MTLLSIGLKLALVNFDFFYSEEPKMASQGSLFIGNHTALS